MNSYIYELDILEKSYDLCYTIDVKKKEETKWKKVIL
nr:MAG TPA: hypothetical protein [Caudoviricetes sp.]